MLGNEQRETVVHRSSKLEDQESPYKINIKEHSRAFYFLSLIKAIILIPILYLCIIQLFELFKRYFQATSTYRVRDANTFYQQGNKSYPTLIGEFPSITICSPKGSKENRLFIKEFNKTTVSSQQLESLFTSIGESDQFIQTTYEYQASNVKPEFFLNWVMFCQVTPSVWSNETQRTWSKLGCPESYIETEYFVDLNEHRSSCLTFTIKNEIKDLAKKMTIVLLLGQDYDYLERETTTKNDEMDPLISGDILEKIDTSLNVYVHSPTEAPDVPFSSLYRGNILHANLLKSRILRQSTDQVLLPFAKSKLCLEKPQQTHRLLSGNMERLFNYSTNICKKLLRQKAIYKSCMCWSSLLPMEAPKPENTYFCDSAKMFLDNATDFAGFLSKRDCHERLLANHSSVFYLTENEDQNCLLKCDQYFYSIMSNQIGQSNRVNLQSFNALIERAQGIRNKLAKTNESSLAIETFLASIGSSLPSFQLASFASVSIRQNYIFQQISVELSDVKIIESDFNFGYTFDVLLSDIGGILGLYLDFTVAGFFEDFDNYLSSLLLMTLLFAIPVMNLAKKIKKKSSQNSEIVTEKSENTIHSKYQSRD